MKKIHWFVLSITLLFGILIGASGATIYFETIIKELALLPRHLPDAAEILTRLDNYCDLDAAQEKQVIEVLRVHNKQLDALKQRHLKEAISIRRSLEKHLDPLLTPEQKKKVKAILAISTKNTPKPQETNSSISD